GSRTSTTSWPTSSARSAPRSRPAPAATHRGTRTGLPEPATPPPPSSRRPSDRSEDSAIASPVTAWAESARSPRPDAFERIGRTVLRLFTSVDFAVVQIIALSLLAVVGMTIRQLPSFAFRSQGDYESAMADIHARYDAVFGRGLVDAMERLQ